MADEKISIDTTARYLVFPLLFLVYLAQAFACRGIFADGADNLYTVLMHYGFNLAHTQRITSHILVQAPLALLIKSGVRNLVFLRYVFSSWLLLLPLAVWAASFWKLRHDILFWPFLLVFCFVYFNIDFFSIGEYGLCFALVAFCFVGLLRPLPPDMWGRVPLLVAAALLPFHYPSTLLHAPLLILMVLTKPRAEWNGASRLYKLCLVFFFLASFASALWEIVLPFNAGNLEQARDPLMALRSIQFRTLLIYGLFGYATYFANRAWLRAVLVGLCLVALVAVYADPLRIYPYPHYALRAYVSAAMCLCGFGLWWFDQLLKNKAYAELPENRLLLAAMSMALLVSMSWYDVQMSNDFGNYVQIFRTTVNSRSGLVTYEMSGLPLTGYSLRYDWTWTDPLMSLILRDGSDKGIILNPSAYHGYQAFDPLKTIPDLSPYYR